MNNKFIFVAFIAAFVLLLGTVLTTQGPSADQITRTCGDAGYCPPPTDDPYENYGDYADCIAKTEHERSDYVSYCAGLFPSPVPTYEPTDTGGYDSYEDCVAQTRGDYDKCESYFPGGGENGGPPVSSPTPSPSPSPSDDVCSPDAYRCGGGGTSPSPVVSDDVCSPDAYRCGGGGTSPSPVVSDDVCSPDSHVCTNPSPSPTVSDDSSGGGNPPGCPPAYPDLEAFPPPPTRKAGESNADWLAELNAWQKQVIAVTKRNSEKMKDFYEALEACNSRGAGDTNGHGGNV